MIWLLHNCMYDYHPVRQQKVVAHCICAMVGNSNLDSHCFNGQQCDTSLVLFCKSLQEFSLLGSCGFNDKLY